MIKVPLSFCAFLFVCIGCEQPLSLPVSNKMSSLQESERCRLIAQLQDKDGNIRLRAANRLAEMRELPDGVLPAFLTMVRDPDHNVRATVAGVLGRFKAEDVIDALIGRILDDSSSYVRKAAMGSIRKLGPDAKRAVPALVRLMQDENSYSKWTKFNDSRISTDCLICHAASALIRIGADSVPALENIIKDVKCNKIVRVPST